MSEACRAMDVSPTRLLCHPAVLVAIAVTALNDHLWKGGDVLPGWATGKISDLAGLFFFPIFLAVLLALIVQALPLRRLCPGPRCFVNVSAVMTVVVFSAINLSAVANDLAMKLWGGFTMDPTDLFCLPVVYFARCFALRRWPVSRTPGLTPRMRTREAVVLCLAGLVSVATSAPQTVTLSGFPYWSLVEHHRECRQGIEFTPWIAKSGKEGFGLVLRLEDTYYEGTSGAVRQVSVERAVVHLQESLDGLHGSAPSVEAPAVEPVQITGRASVYIPFLFNNEAAWNYDLHRATIYIDLLVDGSAQRLRYLAEHRSAEFAVAYPHDQVRILGSGPQKGQWKWAIAIDAPRHGGCLLEER
jgi:hypothetical protein